MFCIILVNFFFFFLKLSGIFTCIVVWLDIAVPRPKPLSTMVTKSNPSKLISQSTFVLAVMEKMQEVAQVEDFTSNGYGTSLSFDSYIQRMSILWRVAEKFLT